MLTHDQSKAKEDSGGKRRQNKNEGKHQKASAKGLSKDGTGQTHVKTEAGTTKHSRHEPKRPEFAITHNHVALEASALPLKEQANHISHGCCIG